jgi:RNA polymerase sigma-70 factor (ECF subfamily)
MPHDAKTHPALIERLISGNEQAFRELFDAMFSALHRLAMVYVLDPDVANDIVQDVFITVYEQSHLIERVRNLDGYLRIAVRNHALNYLRQLDLEDRQRRLYWEEFVELEPEEREELDHLIAKALSALQTLPEACRRCCEMRFVDGMKIKHIAEELSLAESTVKVQLHRGVARIRELVSPPSAQSERYSLNDLFILSLFL